MRCLDVSVLCVIKMKISKFSISIVMFSRGVIL